MSLRCASSTSTHLLHWLPTEFRRGSARPSAARWCRFSSSHNDQLRSTPRISPRNPPSLVLERNWWIRKCLPTPLTLQCECCRIGHEDRSTAPGPYQLCSN